MTHLNRKVAQILLVDDMSTKAAHLVDVLIA